MYEVGQSAEMSKVISGEEILRFAEITGDRNPVHLSEEFAAKTLCVNQRGEVVLEGEALVLLPRSPQDKGR